VTLPVGGVTSPYSRSDPPPPARSLVVQARLRKLPPFAPSRMIRGILRYLRRSPIFRFPLKLSFFSRVLSPIRVPSCDERATLPDFFHPLRTLPCIPWAPFRLSCDSCVLRETLPPNPPEVIGQLKPKKWQIPRSGTPLFRVVSYHQPSTGNFQVLAGSTSRRPGPRFHYLDLEPMPPAMNPCPHHLALAATGFTVVAFSSTAC